MGRTVCVWLLAAALFAAAAGAGALDLPRGVASSQSLTGIPKFDSYSTFLSIEWKTLDHGRLTSHTRARTTEIQQRVPWGTRTINEIFWIVQPDGTRLGNSTQFGQCRDGFDTEWRWSVSQDHDSRMSAASSGSSAACRCWRPKADRPACTSYFENLVNARKIGSCSSKPPFEGSAAFASFGELWRLFLEDSQRFVRLDYCLHFRGGRSGPAAVVPLWHEFAHGNEELNTTQTVIFDRFHAGDPGDRMKMPDACISAVCPAGQQGGWFGPNLEGQHSRGPALDWPRLMARPPVAA